MPAGKLKKKFPSNTTPALHGNPSRQLSSFFGIFALHRSMLAALLAKLLQLFHDFLVTSFIISSYFNGSLALAAKPGRELTFSSGHGSVKNSRAIIAKIGLKSNLSSSFTEVKADKKQKHKY